MRRQIKSPDAGNVRAIEIGSNSVDANYNINHFTSALILSYFNNAPVKKAGAEPGNSNTILAYNDTPKLACFFMRELRTPKIMTGSKLSWLKSMVACNGKGFALCCVPVFAVFQLVTRYRPKAWKLHAVTSEKLNTGVTAMIYQFAGVSRHTYNPTQLKQFRVLAQSETQARALLARDYVLVLIGRLPNTAKNQNTIILGGTK